MPHDYTLEATEAYDMVLEEGTTGTFQKFEAAPADATQPWRGNDNTPLASSLTGVPFVRVSPNEPHLGISRMRDECKEMEMVLIVAPGPGVTDDLLEYDAVLDGSTRWIILDGEKLQPGTGPAVLYYIGVKK